MTTSNWFDSNGHMEKGSLQERFVCFGFVVVVVDSAASGHSVKLCRSIMYPTSSQRKFCTYSSDQQITELRLRHNSGFITKHGEVRRLLVLQWPIHFLALRDNRV